MKAVLDTQFRHVLIKDQVAWYASVVKEMKRHAQKLEAEAGVIGASGLNAN